MLTNPQPSPRPPHPPVPSPQIDKQRRKRQNDNFNRLTLEKKLRALQSAMDVVMECGLVAASQREEAVSRKNSLLEANLDEAASTSSEYSRLTVFIDEQNKLLEMSISKAAAAVKFDETLDTTSIDQRGRLSVENEKDIKDKLLTMSKEMDDSRKRKTVIESQIVAYQRNFQDLKAVSGLDNIDDIVAVFMKNEEETFSLFNFIQTVNQETDKTLEEHARLEEEICAYADDQRKQEESRVAKVKGYKKQVQDSREDRKKMTILAMEEQKTVEKIAKKVQTLFYKIQCDQLLEGGGGGGAKGGGNGNGKGGGGGAGGGGAAISSESRIAVLSGQGVSESNILHFMGLIEERAVQVVGEYVRKLAQQSKDGRRPSLTGVSSRAGGGGLSVAVGGNGGGGGAPDSKGVPKSLDLSDDEGSDEEDWLNGKPMSLDEMRKKVHDKAASSKQKRRERKTTKAGIKAKQQQQQQQQQLQQL